MDHLLVMAQLAITSAVQYPDLNLQAELSVPQPTLRTIG